MFVVDIESEINAAIGEVFERLIDIDSYGEWLPPSKIFLDCQQTSEGPVEPGTTFVDLTRVGTYHGEVTHLEQPTTIYFVNRLEWLGIKVMESHPSYQLKSIEGGTKVHHFGHGHVYDMFKWLEPYIAKRAIAERKRTVRFLKKSFEE